MTDLNKYNPKNTHTDSAAEQQIDTVHANSQQVSVKAWSQKLLVVLLCLASFYGGWKSYESNMINECTANGGQMVEGQRTMLCQLS
ncbi:hypothetical protein [Psychrobacter sp. DAB_AL32B]|uniref:hypothetical protein n=1 Tax=Psychrobacter sp. DAB_AL32B TaxID=1028414 RepID=UPI000B7F6743|nr:hypothetical protein [Psychrobacter sp. DAB_AL32B]OXL28682.1 hypothetical protein CAN34_00475 [Psychrobacter sp. DAB_AL32B]